VTQTIQNNIWDGYPSNLEVIGRCAGMNQKWPCRSITDPCFKM